MARRAPRIPEMREKNEVNCTWGLFSAFESCHTSRKMISNGRPAKKHIIDCPTKLHPIGSFDQECRRIQNETEQNIVKGQQQEHAKMDSELLDRLLKAQNRARKKNSATLIHELPSTSTEISLNKLTLAAILQDNLRRKNSYNSGYPAKASLLNQPSDKIIILKPAPRNSKHSVNVSCHCSSLQSHKNLGRKLSDGKSKFTSFYFRQVKKKLKHTFGGVNKMRNNSLSSFADEETKGNNQCNKRDLNSNSSFDTIRVTETVRKKLDFNKEDFDVILEAKRHLSARLKNVNEAEIVTRKKSPKTLGRILSSPEHDLWPSSPRRDSQFCSGQSPLRPKTEVSSCDDYNRYESMLQIINTNTSSLIPSTDQEKHETDTSAMDGEQKIVLQTKLVEVPSESNSNDVSTIDTSELQKDDETITQSISDSHSENEAFTSTADSNKLLEEHRSPVSVLEPFFKEDSNSPPSITLQTAEKKLQPRRLDFEECSFESLFPNDNQTNITNSYIEDDQDYITEYVHLILEASSLNWDYLSEIEYPPEELLEASLFDEVEFLNSDCYFDPKLLFDHINEILLRIYRCHFCPLPWLPFVEPRIRCEPLAEVVVDEVMKEAEFYLLPRTEKRTLDQLVSKDVADCRSWLDVRIDTEQIVVEISEDVLEGYILDMLVEFYI